MSDYQPVVLHHIGGTAHAATAVRALRIGARGLFADYACELQEIADQIEAQVKPSRIPEPGKWGVVEAYAPEYDQRLHFVRHHDFVTDGRHWQSGPGRYSWDALVDPVLIRDGIES